VSPGTDELATILLLEADHRLLDLERQRMGLGAEFCSATTNAGRSQGVAVTGCPDSLDSVPGLGAPATTATLLTLGIYRRRSPQDLACLLPVQQIGDQRRHPAFADIGVTVDDRCGVDIPDVQFGGDSINLRWLD
jgi:hypothetical protein